VERFVEVPAHPLALDILAVPVAGVPEQEVAAACVTTTLSKFK
jgi:hypothetical protein